MNHKYEITNVRTQHLGEYKECESDLKPKKGIVSAIGGSAGALAFGAAVFYLLRKDPTDIGFPLIAAGVSAAVGYVVGDDESNNLYKKREDLMRFLRKLNPGKSLKNAKAEYVFSEHYTQDV